MRISELAEQAGLSVATVKFYLREGLLPAGEPVSKTQSNYAESHLQRLRLIRALREVADLPVATIATVLLAVDDERLPLVELLGVTQTAVARLRLGSPATDAASAGDLLAELGWPVAACSPLRGSLARVLNALSEQGNPVDATSLRPWADAAWQVAEVEVGHIPLDIPRAAAAHAVATGTVLYGELLSQLRLAAQEALSHRRFGGSRLDQ